MLSLPQPGMIERKRFSPKNSITENVFEISLKI